MKKRWWWLETVCIFSCNLSQRWRYADFTAKCPPVWWWLVEISLLVGCYYCFCLICWWIGLEAKFSIYVRRFCHRLASTLPSTWESLGQPLRCWSICSKPAWSLWEGKTKHMPMAQHHHDANPSAPNKLFLIWSDQVLRPLSSQVAIEQGKSLSAHELCIII